MRKVLIISVLSLLAFSTALIAQPKFEFVGGNTHDWGEVNQQAGPLFTKVKIKNTGDEELKIFSVKPGCGCTTAPIDKDELAPGETAIVDVQLKINKDKGPITKAIEFTSNDPKNDKVSYLLKADIIVPITLFPKFINLGTLSTEEESVGKLVMSNNLKEPIKIERIAVTPKYMKVNIKEGMVLKPGSHNPVEVKVKGTESGMLNGSIKIYTNNKQMEIFTIDVRGMVD